MPPEWMRYKDPLLHEIIAAGKQPRSVSLAETYLLLDTKTGSLSSLLNAPKDWPDDGYLWLDAGRSVVVSHTYLPLDGVTDQEKESRESQPFVVEVALTSGKITKIGNEDLTAVTINASE